MDINSFRQNLTGGGARPSQFEVELDFPSIDGKKEAIYKAKFLIRATALPASILTQADIPFRGKIVKMPGDRIFQNWNITVINDTDFKIRSAFEDWSKLCVDHRTTNGLVPSQLVKNMFVRQLDRNDTVLKEYKMFDCWPLVISEIPLDFNASTNVEEFNVEIAIDSWETAKSGSRVSTSASVA